MLLFCSGSRVATPLMPGTASRVNWATSTIPLKTWTHQRLWFCCVTDRTNNELTNSKSPLSMYFVKYNGSPGSPSSSYFAYLGYGFTKDASIEANATIDVTNNKSERILCAITNETDNFNLFSISCANSTTGNTNCSRKKSTDNWGEPNTFIARCETAADDEFCRRRFNWTSFFYYTEHSCREMLLSYTYMDGPNGHTLTHALGRINPNKEKLTIFFFEKKAINTKRVQGDP